MDRRPGRRCRRWRRRRFSQPRGRVQKCDLCADCRAKNQLPSCVAGCPMRAIEFGPIDKLKQKHPEAVVAMAGLPEPGLTKPNTIYTPHRNAVTGGRI